MSEDFQSLTSTGMKYFQAKKYSLAADSFSRAIDGAHEAGQQTEEAELRNNLSVTLLMLGQAKQAFEAAQGTDKVFEAHGDVKRQAMALGNMAQALEEQKDYAQALALYDQAIELLKGKEYQEIRAMLLRRKALVQGRTGDVYQAVASMDTSIAEKPRLDVKEKLFQKILDKLFLRKKA